MCTKQSLLVSDSDEAAKAKIPTVYSGGSSNEEVTIMSTSNKGFMRLIIFLLVFFTVLISVFSSEQVFFTMFKIVIFAVMVGILFIFIALFKIIKSIKRYFDIQQEAEYDFERFFNDFYSAEFEFKRYQESKQAQEEFWQYKNAKRYGYENKQKQADNIDTNKLTKALILFGYKDLSQINKDELKKKYRVLIKKAHPDNGGSEEKTQLINESYRLLLKIL